MTATIIEFPSMHERNDREFERTGSTSYTRAVEEAHTLGGLVNQRVLNRAVFLKRVDALEAATIGLAAWREEVDAIILIEMLPGAWAPTTLRALPKLLRDRISGRGRPHAGPQAA